MHLVLAVPLAFSRPFKKYLIISNRVAYSKRKRDGTRSSFQRADSLAKLYFFLVPRFVVGFGAGRSGSEAQVVMQVRGERSSPLGHALCTTKRRASEGRNGISYVV